MSKAWTFVHSEDYHWAKEKLTALMAASDSVSLLDETLTDEQVGQEAKAIKKAQNIVKTWFDILETESKQFEMAEMRPNKEPAIIKFN